MDRLQGVSYLRDNLGYYIYLTQVTALGLGLYRKTKKPLVKEAFLF
jgi:hypothetical protein